MIFFFKSSLKINIWNLILKINVSTELLYFTVHRKKTVSFYGSISFFSILTVKYPGSIHNSIWYTALAGRLLYVTPFNCEITRAYLSTPRRTGIRVSSSTLLLSNKENSVPEIIYNTGTNSKAGDRSIKTKFL